MNLGTVFVIDGSGDKNQKRADHKRPIYRLDVNEKTISRPLLGEVSALDFFRQQINKASRPILIAVDVPIGLPALPSDVYETAKATTFLEWLDTTDKRLVAEKLQWRDGLIADGFAKRSSAKPFVSITDKGQKANVKSLRECDRHTNGESVYCVDHGAKQVGKAALQFWFEVLLPLRREFTTSLVVWPFEPTENKKIVVAECYPAQCQRDVYSNNVSKRQAVDVANSLIFLRRDRSEGVIISHETWMHAASSEDEFDMFTTAFAFCSLLTANRDLFWHPTERDCTTKEGWMLGLRLDENGSDERRRTQTRRGTVRSKSTRSTKWKETGTINRNGQKNLGESGNRGPMGPLFGMVCERVNNGIACGHKYETNAQDIFHKKCPKCQRKLRASAQTKTGA